MKPWSWRLGSQKPMEELESLYRKVGCDEKRKGAVLECRTSDTPPTIDSTVVGVYTHSSLQQRVQPTNRPWYHDKSIFACLLLIIYFYYFCKYTRRSWLHQSQTRATCGGSMSSDDPWIETTVSTCNRGRNHTWRRRHRCAYYWSWTSFWSWLGNVYMYVYM